MVKETFRVLLFNINACSGSDVATIPLNWSMHILICNNVAVFAGLSNMEQFIVLILSLGAHKYLKKKIKLNKKLN